MSIDAPIPIDGPPPIPPPFNLFTVASEIPASEIPRWMNGVVVEAYPVDTPFAHDPCSTGSSRQKSLGEVPPLPPFKAFDAYTPVSCTRRTVRSDAELRRRVRMVLEATDAFAAEHELVSGALTGNPALADTNMAGANILGTGLDAREGLARLEDAIAATGRAGVIHAPRSVITAWGFDSLRVDGRVLRTANGTPVIAGSGYTDVVPPGGGALGDEKQWAYATGPVLYARGDLTVLPPEGAPAATDRETNTTTYRAERALLVVWDTVLQAGVEIDRAA